MTVLLLRVRLIGRTLDFDSNNKRSNRLPETMKESERIRNDLKTICGILNDQSTSGEFNFEMQGVFRRLKNKLREVEYRELPKCPTGFPLGASID